MLGEGVVEWLFRWKYACGIASARHWCWGFLLEVLYKLVLAVYIPFSVELTM